MFGLDSLQQWTQQAKLTASDGAANHQLGIHVDIHDSTVLAGTAIHETVYVYTRSTDTNTWKETQRIQKASTLQFGHDSFAIKSDWIAIGAAGDGELGENAGAVFVYQKNPQNGLFEEEAKLLAKDGMILDKLGSAVDIDASGNVLACAYGNDSADFVLNSREGACYFFTDNNGGGYSQRFKFRADDPTLDMKFGKYIQWDGRYAIIGVPDTESAYVFKQIDETSWEQQIKFQAPTGVAVGEFFGSAVSISNNQVAIGAYLHQRENRKAGAVFVFEREIVPTAAPTSTPTQRPTVSPTGKPTIALTMVPTHSPTSAPTASTAPSSVPTTAPSITVSSRPSVVPTSFPSNKPSSVDSASPSGAASQVPSNQPSLSASANPTGELSATGLPTVTPTETPSATAATKSPTSSPQTTSPTISPAVETLAPSAGNNGPTAAPQSGTLVPSETDATSAPQAGTSTPTLPSLTPGTTSPTMEDGPTTAAPSNPVEPTTTNPSPFLQTYQFLQPKGVINSHFGLTLAKTGNFAVLGAPKGSSAYVYRRDFMFNQWFYESTLNVASATSFASAVGITEDETAIVGSHSLVGQRVTMVAYLYEWEPSKADWAIRQKLSLQIGESSETTPSVKQMAMDTYQNKFIMGELGVVGLFKKESGVWSQEARIEMPLPKSDSATMSLSLHQDVFVCGISNGMAVVFARTSQGDWLQQDTLKPPQGDAAIGFGRSVTVHGDTILVGATEAVYVFRAPSASKAAIVRRDSGLTPGYWKQTDVLYGETSRPNSGFGTTVALEKYYAVIGAAEIESVYAIPRSPISGDLNLAAQETLKTPGIHGGSMFGASLVLEENELLVGAHLHKRGQPPVVAGTAYLYSLKEIGDSNVVSSNVVSEMVPQTNPPTATPTSMEDATMSFMPTNKPTKIQDDHYSSTEKRSGSISATPSSFPATDAFYCFAFGLFIGYCSW